MALWKTVALSLYSNSPFLALDALKTFSSSFPQNVNVTLLLKRSLRLKHFTTKSKVAPCVTSGSVWHCVEINKNNNTERQGHRVGTDASLNRTDIKLHAYFCTFE